MVRLLEGRDCVPVVLQVTEEGARLVVLSPFYGVLRAKGRFVKVFVLRGARKASEVDVLDAGCVGRSKHRPDVVDRAHVVHDESYRVLRKCWDLLRSRSLNFIPTKLAHEATGGEICKCSRSSEFAFRIPVSFRALLTQAQRYVFSPAPMGLTVCPRPSPTGHRRLYGVSGGRQPAQGPVFDRSGGAAPPSGSRPGEGAVLRGSSRDRCASAGVGPLQRNPSALLHAPPRRRESVLEQCRCAAYPDGLDPPA